MYDVSAGVIELWYLVKRLGLCSRCEGVGLIIGVPHISINGPPPQGYSHDNHPYVSISKI